MTTSGELERRALAWEHLGRAVERVDLDIVVRLAGADTWLGPTADEFGRVVSAARRQLTTTGAEAVRQAAYWRREAQAARARELAGQPI